MTRWNWAALTSSSPPLRAAGNQPRSRQCLGGKMTNTAAEEQEEVIMRRDSHHTVSLTLFLNESVCKPHSQVQGGTEN